VSEAHVLFRPSMRPYRWQRANGMTLAAMALVTTLVACTHSPHTSLPAAAAAIPSASKSSANAAVNAAGKAAVDAYDAALTYEVGAFVKMNPTAASLKKYLGEPDLDGAVFATGYYRSQGIVYHGKPSWTATPTNVDLTANPPVVTLSICFTTNGWRPIYKSSGRPYSTSKDPAHQLEIASVTRVDGKWLLTQEQVQGKPC
jgi:hypothetical protein